MWFMEDFTEEVLFEMCLEELVVTGKLYNQIQVNV